MKLKIALVFILAASSSFVKAAPIITLDGKLDGAAYSNSETVSWYNGHKPFPDSIYGDFGNQLGSTTVRHGVGELGGTDYFFLYVEAPLYVKNMIWENSPIGGWTKPLTNTNPLTGLTENDVASYRAHHETHHGPGDMKLDFGGATGSEKVIFVNDSGSAKFTANIAGNASNSYGLVGFKDSVDYLIDNNISTSALSLARDTALSVELQFDLNASQNNAILDLVRNGIEFHLSPERGLAVTSQEAQLGNYLWLDQNGNGLQDQNETGVGGVNVTLSDNNSVLDMQNTLADGSYGFDNLDPGDYKVTFDLPNGYKFTNPNIGGDDALDSDANLTNGMTQIVSLLGGDSDLTLDAGIFQPASLGDFVWFDENENGIQDVGELPVEDVMVTLMGTDGYGNLVLDSQFTDADGEYLFDDLNPGEYKITFSDLPTNYGFTTQGNGNGDFDSDANVHTGATRFVTLSSGDLVRDLDAGLVHFALPPPTPATVPEPASLVIWSLLGLGIAGYGLRRRRDR